MMKSRWNWLVYATAFQNYVLHAYPRSVKVAAMSTPGLLSKQLALRVYSLCQAEGPTIHIHAKPYPLLVEATWNKLYK